MHLKLFQKEQFKKKQEIDDLIDNKIAGKIMKISRMSPDNNLETVTNEDDKEMPKERCISPGDDLMI